MLRRLGSFRALPKSMSAFGDTSKKRSWRHMADKKRGFVLFLQVAVLVFVIAAWEIASRFQWLDPFFFSQPSVFGARALRWLAQPGFLLGGRSIYHHLLVTMEEM